MSKKQIKVIKGLTLGSERALYHTCDALILSCAFEGEEDGESALKECRDIKVEDCSFSLRYPLWHASNFEVVSSKVTKTCRASLWYDSQGIISDIHIEGVKALRECHDIKIDNSYFDSEEFGWKCSLLDIKDSSVISPYAFFNSKDINIVNLSLIGKYSFQYVDNMVIKDSKLDTKDAFWHSHNVTVINSVIKGEYLGWFSDGLTLINCQIIGTQPLCYCKNLKIVDCEMIDADLAFEYSEVDASIKGNVLSIKNPKSGHILLDSVGEIITSDSAYECTATIEIRNKNH